MTSEVSLVPVAALHSLPLDLRCAESLQLLAEEEGVSPPPLHALIAITTTVVELTVKIALEATKNTAMALAVTVETAGMAATVVGAAAGVPVQAAAAAAESGEEVAVVAVEVVVEVAARTKQRRDGVRVAPEKTLQHQLHRDGCGPAA